VFLFAAFSGIGWMTSQCSTTLPSSHRKMSTTASPRGLSDRPCQWLSIGAGHGDMRAHVSSNRNGRRLDLCWIGDIRPSVENLRAGEAVGIAAFEPDHDADGPVRQQFDTRGRKIEACAAVVTTQNSAPATKARDRITSPLPLP
jgi:hypothetical protein